MKAGIIPARAGTTNFIVGIGRFFEDHPCACRDYCTRQLPWLLRPGSSLRVQGLLKSSSYEDAAKGIIPARAGTT